ncbi:coproporphyrinogen dehydrogenase HemZ [Acetobacterium bakii]|uniref:coproporphyrinogen dehydrogenase HemZ n=1 Tax=Acetobacterium bakii TaxID=52689 RepID=UPI0006816AD9|nr:coproporphyrinogen dehydrogenase HemZ [Acetobacterium bakii]
MRILRFDLDRPELEYYFHELYQAFDPGVKNVIEGDAGGVLFQRCEGKTLLLSLSWEGSQALEKRFEFNNNDEPLDNSIYKGFLYELLCEYFNKTLEWGILTGIKPVRIAQKCLSTGMSMSAVEEKFRNYYRANADRTQLIMDLTRTQAPFVSFENQGMNKKLVSLYVGIPLCPAKCSYCSFISTVVDKNGLNLEAYFNNLLVEVHRIGGVFRAQEVIIDTLYIGGGTPTVLSAEQLDVLMAALEKSFNLTRLREYTLEAGRSETITEEKLVVAKRHGVQRLCLNPQTMNAKTLAAVGRYWEKGLVEKQAELIKKMEFKTLNMDLIIGLADENPDDFMFSLKAVMALDPENITIHNLSIKKGSEMKHAQGIQVSKGYGEDFYQRVRKILSDNGYEPYYLYRLKYTQGNSENIGYSKRGHEGIYNILMMAERQSIIGIGAGSTGKLYDPADDSINRVFTVKDIKTYNDRIDQIIEKKVKAYEFFDL